MKGGKGKATTKKETPEVLKASDDRLGKRKVAAKANKSSKSKDKKDKGKKDPNKPKRPASAFFVFLEEFREIYKREHPNVKAVSAVGKAGGEKWKALTRAEKAPYEAKAAKRKSEYEKQMSAYNKKQESIADDGDEDSDRSKSEVNDEDDEESGEGFEICLHVKSWITRLDSLMALGKAPDKPYFRVVNIELHLDYPPGGG